MIFEDRHDAGRRLASRLLEYRGQNAVVLALPRGGVAVGYEAAVQLGLPLDVIITRKIGAPGNPEYGIGAVAENGEVELNLAEIAAFGISEGYLAAELARQKVEIDRQRQLYRNGRSLPPWDGKIAILVDDGIATGYTMKAAIRAAWAARAQSVVVAVPLAPEETVASMQDRASKVICLVSPDPFYAVGAWYREFPQVSDAEVLEYLDAIRSKAASSS